MDIGHAMVTDFPIGYRFLPTDEELIRYYLTNKVFYRPIPAQDIKDITASELYSKPPKTLVENMHAERGWYFFIHQDEHFRGKKRTIRNVGNGFGYWRSLGEEDPIYNSDGNVSALKVYLTYYSGSLPKAKRTHWKMEEYRLHIQCGQEVQEIEEWVLVRITKGRDNTSNF